MLPFLFNPSLGILFRNPVSGRSVGTVTLRLDIFEVGNKPGPFLSKVGT
jgi:hypothetical protein